MHWPIAFKPEGEPFPRDNEGKIILDKETTVEDVPPHPCLSLFLLPPSFPQHPFPLRCRLSDKWE